jgi:hypothetical protein
MYLLMKVIRVNKWVWGGVGKRESKRTEGENENEYQ